MVLAGSIDADRRGQGGAFHHGGPTRFNLADRLPLPTTQACCPGAVPSAGGVLRAGARMFAAQTAGHHGEVACHACARPTDSASMVMSPVEF